MSDITRRQALTAAAAGIAATAALSACSSPAPQSSASQAASTAAATASTGYFPAHSPIGTAQGLHPGRVSWAYDPTSVSWGGSGYWWELAHFDEAAIRTLVDTALTSLAGTDDAKSAWSALFAHHNGADGYQAGQRIVIKPNMNGAAEYDDDPDGLSDDSYCNPVLLKCVLASLVEDAGVAPSCITVLDATRIFPRYLREICSEGALAGVVFADRTGGAEADPEAPIAWSKPIDGSACYLPACVTQADYVINLANMKGHNYGVTLCAKNHFGSFVNDNPLRAPSQAGLHPLVSNTDMGVYNPLVDLMGHAHLGAKTVLYLLDAILCPSENTVAMTPENCTWEQTPFAGSFTTSVLASQDPVAIDSVAADFLANEPMLQRLNANLNLGMENYLHEAAQADNPPSGTAYTDGAGQALKSLGVHEHWDDVETKRYSKDRGEADGIELVRTFL